MSYDEHLITQAGGNGEPQRHDLAVDRQERAECLCGWWVSTGSRPANLEMLQRHIKAARSSEYGKVAEPLIVSGTWEIDTNTPTTPTAPAPAPRTEDYTVKELFPDGAYMHPLAYGAYFCAECGGLVGDLERHVSWHNKLLP